MLSDISSVSKRQSEYGSFRDSLRAPVHRWFTYPAGYSYKFVQAKIAEFGLTNRSTIGDPFLGTGTTSLAARMVGVNSIGVEAHRFVCWVAQTKLFLNHNLAELSAAIQEILETGESLVGHVRWSDSWPPLIYKCFSDDNLQVLAALRQAILQLKSPPHVRDFLKLALTTTLRVVTTAGAGWPYIAPSKHQAKKVTRDAMIEFRALCNMMFRDVQFVLSLELPHSIHEVMLADARQFDEYTGEESLDLVVTSPPYLNNYDYADRTRLETYFWGQYSSWADITRDVRDNLILAATTQVRMASMNGLRACPQIRATDQKVHSDLTYIIDALGEMRRIKKGKKTYDYVVAGYFEDMLRVIVSSYKALKPEAKMVLVVGDSAPYGVHIPTEELIGRLALSVGFSSYTIEELRRRGGKWGHNTQRHKVPLRESILTLSKE